MCKFHQDIALDVARRPDGTVDPTAYAINIIALGANCSIKHYMPSMKGVKGSMTYKLASHDSQEAFKQSGLTYDKNAFETYRSDTLALLQESTQATIQKYGFDQQRPKVIKNRIKSFLQVAPDELYMPFNSLSQDIFPTAKQAESYQHIRLASADYWNKTNVEPVLKERFKQSVTALFHEAPGKTDPALMKIYEAMPDKLKQFGACAGGICSSAGGTVLGHIGCLAKLALAPTLGATSGIANNPSLMYGMMTGGTALGLGAWQYMHYRQGTLPTKLENFTTYGTAIIGLGALIAWHQFADGHDHHQHKEKTANIIYFDDKAGRRFMVREDLICDPNGNVTRVRPDTFQISGPVHAKTKTIAP